MNNFPKGNDLIVKWAIKYSDGTPFPLENYAWELCYSAGRGINVVKDTAVISVSDNLLTWRFSGKDQAFYGKYSLTLRLYQQGKIVATVRKNNAFELSTTQYDGPCDIDLVSYCDNISLQDALLRGNRAMEVAQGAKDIAGSAVNTAAGAVTTANEAKNIASTANNTSTEAKTIASNAKTVADQAKVTADATAATATQKAEEVAQKEAQLEATLNNLSTDQSGALALSTKVNEHGEKLSKLDSVMLLLGTAPEDKSITIQRTASYINKNGEIITSSNNYSVSSPIAINKGECLLVKASAFANQAVISTTNESGSVYTPKVLGESSSLVNRLYSYVAEADGYIAICGYNNDFPAYVKIASSDIINQIDERLSDTESMRPLLDGISDEIGYENKTETLTIQRSGYAIKTDGSVIQSDGFNVSNPVSLKMGQTIIVSGSAWVSRALIALTDEQGTAYTPVVLGESTTNLVSSTFRYTAQEDCYVAISSYVNDFPTSAIIRRAVILCDIQNNISKDKEKYGMITAESMPLLHGGWYNTFGKKVGDIATLAYNSHIDYSSINILVSKGDVFYVTGKAGNSPRLWAFLDSATGEILEFSSATADETNKRIVAPRDCRLVVNVNIIASLKYGVMKENPTLGMISNRESFTHLEAISDNPLKKINYFLGYAGIIHHWGFVGDSLMGGFMENSGISQYEYSWGQRMCQLLGVEGYNFSVGGMTAKDWIYNTSGYNSQRVWSGAKTNLKQAYIIGLGVNDRNQSYEIGDVSTDIGTYDSETDSDTNAATFAGYYAGIIQRLQSVQPNAKIFVVTMPHNIGWANVNDYNNVIRAMATKFSNVYVIDLYTYADNYYFDREWESNLFDSGHFNVIGYEYGASVMMTYIDWIIRNNYSDFKNVNMIEV